MYLNVALAWVVARSAHCPVMLRTERGRPSGYSYRKLAHHFWTMVLTSGTGPLRLVALIGVVSVFLALALTAYTVWGKLSGRVEVSGWASLLIVVSLFQASSCLWECSRSTSGSPSRWRSASRST